MMEIREYNTVLLKDKYNMTKIKLNKSPINKKKKHTTSKSLIHNPSVEFNDDYFSDVDLNFEHMLDNPNQVSLKSSNLTLSKSKYIYIIKLNSNYYHYYHHYYYMYVVQSPINSFDYDNLSTQISSSTNSLSITQQHQPLTILVEYNKGNIILIFI